MAGKIKGRNGGDHATPKTSNIRNHSQISSRIKTTVVMLALWGVPPCRVVDWIIQHGGLRDA